MYSEVCNDDLCQSMWAILHFVIDKVKPARVIRATTACRFNNQAEQSVHNTTTTTHVLVQVDHVLKLFGSYIGVCKLVGAGLLASFLLR